MSQGNRTVPLQTSLGVAGFLLICGLSAYLFLDWDNRRQLCETWGRGCPEVALLDGLARDTGEMVSEVRQAFGADDDLRSWLVQFHETGIEKGLTPDDVLPQTAFETKNCGSISPVEVQCSVRVGRSGSLPGSMSWAQWTDVRLFKAGGLWHLQR